MDHLQEAKDFTEYACERLDQGKTERAQMNAQIAIAHALIAMVERMDAVTNTTWDDPLSGKTAEIPASVRVTSAPY